MELRNANNPGQQGEAIKCLLCGLGASTSFSKEVVECMGEGHTHWIWKSSRKNVLTVDVHYL